MGTRRGSKEEDMSLCPICDQLQPVSQIQAHCEAHFVEQEDVPPARLPQDLAQPPPRRGEMQALTGGSAAAGRQPAPAASDRPSSVRAERPLQPAASRGPGDDLVSMIARCVENQQGGGITAAVAGSTDHYQSEPTDAGWGCGYRNIQMLVSNLLSRNQMLKDALFDGCGFVPDIPSLQALVEAAWAKGWDTAGKDQLGGRLRGMRTWIGTTECAALLRCFGLQAKIVDFEGGRGHVLLREAEAQGDIRARGEDDEGAACDASGNDEVHPGVQCDGCDQYPITGPCYTSKVMQDYDLCSRCRRQPQAERAAPYSRRQGRKRGHEDNGPALVKWVWKHFTGEDADSLRRADSGSSHGGGGASGASNALQHLMSSSRRNRVIRSNKSPLYFQHEGHSRTIVGIEHRRQQDGEVWSLLILDPNERTQSLREALLSGHGWQRKLKRGLHALRKAEYQVLYVEDELMSAAEREDSKIIRADERF